MHEVMLIFIREGEERCKGHALGQIFLDQARLRTEVPRTPSSTRLGFERMTSRS